MPTVNGKPALVLTLNDLHQKRMMLLNQLVEAEIEERTKHDPSASRSEVVERAVVSLDDLIAEVERATPATPFGNPFYRGLPPRTKEDLALATEQREGFEAILEQLEKIEAKAIEKELRMEEETDSFGGLGPGFIRAVVGVGKTFIKEQVAVARKREESIIDELTRTECQH